MKPKSMGVVLGLLVLSACGGDSDGATDSTTSPTSTVVEDTVAPLDSVTTTTSVDDGIVRISVTVGVDSGPDRVEEVSAGTSVELSLVNPEEDDEFHVHGFDLGGDETPAGEEKVFAFTVTEAGDFEVESHVTGEVLVVIRVS
jgi:hypothetical protein